LLYVHNRIEKIKFKLTCRFRCVLQEDTRLSIRCHAVLTDALETATLDIKKNTQHLASLLHGGSTIS